VPLTRRRPVTFWRLPQGAQATLRANLIPSRGSITGFSSACTAYRSHTNERPWVAVHDVQSSKHRAPSMRDAKSCLASVPHLLTVDCIPARQRAVIRDIVEQRQ
jgi:hypothetical protein